MGTIRICPVCHKPLAEGAPDGLCPECLMKAGLGTDVDIGPETQGESVQKASPAPTPEEIRPHFPHLEVQELLGQGGMAAVYKARQPHLNRLVALKILTSGNEKEPAFAERFTREAQTLARLNHPNIVTLYDFGKVDGLFYLVMEYVDGVSLRQLLQTRKLSPEEALTIVPKICDALQYAHEHGVVHRDIKPENVLLNAEGRVKIADFGIAKMVGGGPGQEAITREEQVIGTPHYMAPEQVEHPQQVDHRADIYSLGVVFYEMLTGELPLGKFAPPSQRVQIDVRLDEVVLHALEKDRERRYQQAGQVKTAVETITSTPLPAAAEFSGAAPSSRFPAGHLSWVEALRWSARLLGSSLVLFFLLSFGLFLFGLGLPPLALQSGGTLLNYLALALTVLGMIVGWKLDGTAAALTAMGWALWHSSNGSLTWSMFHLALLVAALYAFCWWATHERRTLVLTAATGVLAVLLVCGMLFLPTNVYFYGTVTDAVTHEAIRDAELIVSRLSFPPTARPSEAPVRSLPSGYYALHVGWYAPQKSVRVTAPGYAPLQIALGPKPLGTRRIPRDFALSPIPVGPEALLFDPWWGQASSERIASEFSASWLPRLSYDNALLRLGFALYDTQRYSDALQVFCRMEQVGEPGMALVWQGHMLDLLGRRSEAIIAYQKALSTSIKGQHDQYGIVLTKAYVEQRLKTPFTRLENRSLEALREQLKLNESP